jgi:HD-GYP domain-containing protein (c-di-GMP phosphodiesterase class II)
MSANRIVQLLALLVVCAAVPVLSVLVAGDRMVMPPGWLHFYGVGLSAVAATFASIELTRRAVALRDPRTVLIGGGFAFMAALLAVHGLTTPGVIVGMNGVIKLTGAATVPVGGAVLVLSTLGRFASPLAIPRMVMGQMFCAGLVVALSVVAMAFPSLVPAVPDARSPVAFVVLAIGVALYAALGIRAGRTFLLTRRAADLAVLVGLAFLAASVYGALMLTYMQLGWWLGHLYELVGITLVGASVGYDLRRGGQAQSRPLFGDLSPSSIVAEEEAFLGARVRALMLRLAAKDGSTEEHTRRVATLAVQVGEQLGLPPARLRRLALGGLLHDIGKLGVPSSVLQKPGALTDEEYDQIKRHPEHGRELLSRLGGFDGHVHRLVLDHHERLDGGGYPRGLGEADLDLETRILSVCDVYDALVSPRVYRGAWPPERAVALLREETGRAFDPRCVQAIVAVVGASAGGGRLAA